MCSLPSAPPPPPPPPPLLTLDLTKVSTQPVATTEPVQKVENWSSGEHEELWLACSKNDICTKEPPFRYKFQHFPSILQVGPTCGLVALSMLIEGQVSAEDMLVMTKENGFSNNGEMFSCQYMGKLAEKVFNVAGIHNIEYNVKKGGLSSRETVEKLLNGAILLVPYDADFNHSPCLKQGHTAHWALICGIIITEDPGDSYENITNIYLLGKHGKSKYLAAWNLEDIKKSNQNLYEFAPKKGKEDWIYILPEGGVGGENGLRDQFLMFEFKH